MAKTRANSTKQQSKGLFKDCQEYQELQKKSNKTETDLKKLDELYKKIKTQMMMFYVLFVNDDVPFK